MSLDADDEILQDFLIEAGEILEQLSEQLVDLEQRPEDSDLLNAIFRGFHTVKGGAGFLQLTALVDCCHFAENIFDRLRNGQRKISPDLMDVFLQVLDTVNEMFNMVRDGQMPSPASPDLMKKLEFYAKEGSAEEYRLEETPEFTQKECKSKPDVSTSDPVVESESSPTPPDNEMSSDPSVTEGSDGNREITDEEFELLLDALDQDPTRPSSPATQSDTSDVPQDSNENHGSTQLIDENEDITEEEFESLLNKLHASKEKSDSEESKADTSASNNKTNSDGAKTLKQENDDISDTEFEQLLDKLHGSGPVESTNGPMPSEPDTNSENASISASASQKTITASPTSKKSETSASLDSVDNVSSDNSLPVDKIASHTQSNSKPSNVSKTADTRQKAQEIPAAEATVRVDTKRLDDIMNMVGELVLVRNRLVRLGLKSSDESMAKAVANLDVVTGDLQASVMKTRMQPIKKVFGRFPRVVRDLARTLKKEVNLELKGEDTDLDKNLVEALADPLVHLVRNAVDHGIEMPDDREEKGKPRTGKVILAAEQEGDHILLSIRDDGNGMNADSLRRKAVEKGLYDQDSADRLTDSECFNLIFSPGFSTKSEISDISGRGVGMDVVKTKISQLNGTINIESIEGKGSSFMIKVPLTLAIMPTLMVMLGKQAFALPLVNVNEIFHLDLSKTNRVDGKEVAVIREKALPLFHLKRWLVSGAFDTSVPEQSHVVVVSVGTQKVGFVVDQLIGQEEVVIKPLGKMLQGTPGMAGATITGDGRIALILDVPSMLNRYA